MTLNLFLIESAGSHSLHRPGWTIEEEPPDSAQYHAAKTRVKLFVNFTLKLRPGRPLRHQARAEKLTLICA